LDLGSRKEEEDEGLETKHNSDAGESDSKLSKRLDTS
jgi:hypothetical protein